MFLSNGPGDPDAVTETYEQVRKLMGKVPMFGICLGHQMVSLAAGARMEKLKYGHRGGNHPVMNLITRRVEITAQNHGFNLVFPSLGALVPELSGGAAEHPAGADGTAATGDLRFWVEQGVAPVVENERFGRIRLTHVNLNDGTAEGIQLLDAPVFFGAIPPRSIATVERCVPITFSPRSRTLWTATPTTWTSTSRAIASPVGASAPRRRAEHGLVGTCSFQPPNPSWRATVSKGANRCPNVKISSAFLSSGQAPS